MAQTRHIWILTALVVALGLSAGAGQAAKPVKKPAKPAPVAKPAPQKVAVVEGTALALPAGCKVKVRWVCPPLDAKKVDEADWYGVRFVVDNAGRPWFGVGSDDIISPTQQYRFTFNHLYNDIACLDNGAFLMCTDSDLGFVAPPEAPKVDYDGKPLALFQPIAGLPVPDCRLFPGAGNCVYLTGWNPATEMHEVYLLRPDKLTIGGTGVREYVKVFSSKSDINAVAGDGQKTYVAVEQVILKVTGSDCSKVHVERNSAVMGLAYSPEAGLFFSTWNTVGYIGTNGILQLMAVSEPQICLQRNSLYVLLKKTMGVLALDNVQDMKRYNLAFDKVPATQSNEVKVRSVRFFEAGETPPAYAERQYAAKFSKAATRFVYCQVDMTNLLKGKRTHTQFVRMELCAPGQTSGLLEDMRLDVPLDLADIWGWARFGSDSPGTFYPGTYTLKTYLNGGKIDERRFTVEGEPTVFEAAYFGDTAKLWKLLGAGADANMVGADGMTPLMTAVSNGSMEIVRLLLDHKASLNLKSNEGETALLIASSRFATNLAAMRLLLEAGADANIADKDGETPLHRVASGNNLEAMRLLLDHGANPNARDNEGRTPLLSLELGYGGYEYGAKPEHVEILLSHGADVNAVGTDGYTAMSEAISGGSPDIVRLLVKHGANVNAIGQYEGGTRYSVLGNEIVSCNTEADRLNKAKMKEIISILCQGGAQLLPEEMGYALSTGTINLLGRKQIAYILEHSEDAVRTYQPEDPWMQRLVLKRLMQMAYLKVSWASSASDFTTSLGLCMEAKARAEKWGLESLVPEVYYTTGMLSVKTGADRTIAAQCLRRYLELAPNGWRAGSARDLLNGL